MILTSDAAIWRRPICVLALCCMLSACGVLEKPTRSAVYDFGPGLGNISAPAPAGARPAVTLADVSAPDAFDSTAVLYRLAYSDVQQLLPYAQARWSMPPAQLLRQRLRESLGRHHLVLREGDSAASGAVRPLLLQLELDEFSQLFDSPGKSVGLVRVHATIVQPSPSGDRLLAQRDFVSQSPAASPDAAGGVRALTVASDSVLQEISLWLTSLR